MNMNFAGGEMQSFAIIAILWGLFVSIMWLIIGWRAMKAHEKIAGAVQEYLRRKL